MVKRPVFFVFLIASAGCLRGAQTPPEPWERLAQLREGEKIEVVDARMKSHTGEFAAYTREGISFRRNGVETTVPLAEVASVKRRAPSHRRRNALIGAAIGAAGGFAVGAVRGKTYHESGETPVFVAVWTPIGAGAGAVAGALVPAGDVTVYRASKIGR